MLPFSVSLVQHTSPLIPTTPLTSIPSPNGPSRMSTPSWLPLTHPLFGKSTLIQPPQVFIPSNGVPSLWTFPLAAFLIIHGPLGDSFMAATSSILGNPQKDSSTSGTTSPTMNSSTSSILPQICGQIKRVLTTEPSCPHGIFRTHTTTNNVCGSWVPPPSSTEQH